MDQEMNELLVPNFLAAHGK